MPLSCINSNNEKGTKENHNYINLTCNPEDHTLISDYNRLETIH